MQNLYNTWRIYMKTKATKIEDFVDIFTPFPLKEKNEIDNYFVKTYDARGTNAISRIAFALNSTRNPFMKILFMGHRGSGKSTELFLLNEKIKSIRDLFQIIRESAFEAMEAGHFKIELEDVKNSYKQLKSEYERLIRTEEDVRKLKQIYNDPKLLTSDETLMSLLLRGLVLEYNGERWCGIHPAIEDFLCEKGEINGKQSTN